MLRGRFLAHCLDDEGAQVGSGLGGGFQRFNRAARAQGRVLRAAGAAHLIDQTGRPEVEHQRRNFLDRAVDARGLRLVVEFLEIEFGQARLVKAFDQKRFERLEGRQGGGGLSEAAALGRGGHVVVVVQHRGLTQGADDRDDLGKSNAQAVREIIRAGCGGLAPALAPAARGDEGRDDAHGLGAGFVVRE